jgi:hypothetical protein
LSFQVYRIKFSEIKDFDFDHVHTQYSNFDYEKTEYNRTEEEKIYAIEYRDQSIPQQYKVDRKNLPSQYEISNISSEYIADDELFEIENNNLTDIWKKVPSICKWGIMGSISHSDYNYKLNNSLSVGGILNKTTDPFLSDPIIVHKNLDYFYRIGNFYSGDTGSTLYYFNQSTNIQTDFLNLNNFAASEVGFDLNLYLTGSFDYFNYYFKNKMYYEDNKELYIKNYRKYAVFNSADGTSSSETVFKGIKLNYTLK